MILVRTRIQITVLQNLLVRGQVRLLCVSASWVGAGVPCLGVAGVTFSSAIRASLALSRGFSSRREEPKLNRNRVRLLQLGERHSPVSLLGSGGDKPLQ